MSLTFLTPLMLAGAMLVAAPIILHLIMRQQPKHLVFPALRFIRLRNDSNKRRLRLRHILLLLLRCAVIVFLALALSRPSVQSAGFLGDQEAPVAAALVFDTSPRMQYRLKNQTRLQVAQEIAGRVLTQLPRESDVAVIDSRTATAAFSIDAAIAQRRIEGLAVTAAAEPLSDMCSEALRLVDQSTKGRKEIYVFTDLGRAAWSEESTVRLKNKLAENKDVALYVIDVGVDDPQNIALGDLHLSADTLSKNTPLHFESDVATVGSIHEQRTVALDTIDNSGQPQRRDQTTINASPDQPQPVEFTVGGFELGTHQGTVRIVGEDSLAADDVRYFTVDIHSPWKVLLAAPKADLHNAETLAEALAPATWRRTGQARFECQIIPLDQLSNQPLDDYAAVCLVDPTPLTDGVWQSLTSFVERGGGLAIWLGKNAQPKGARVEDFNTAAAAKLMPGKLDRIWRRQDVFLAPADYQHPILSKFRSLHSGVPWEEFPIDSHWQLADFADGVNTIIPLSNGQPALVERGVGKGRVLLFTTPISDDAADPELWNLLVVGSQPWPFFMLSNEMLLYLAGNGEERLNYSAGETVVLQLPENQRQLIFSLRTPEGEEDPQSVDQKTGTITVSRTNSAGNYLLRSGGSQGGVRRGFSVNIPAASTDLARLSKDELTSLLGKDRFRLSRGRAEIERDVNLGRAGRELYPLLIVLVALVLGLEHLLANKFHRRDPQAEQPTHQEVATALAVETKTQQEVMEVA
jgi:hypothetical protein